MTKMKQTLKNILTKEGLSLPDTELEFLYEQSEGDIRSAVNSLQFFFTDRNATVQKKKKSIAAPKTKHKYSDYSQTDLLLYFLDFLSANLLFFLLVPQGGLDKKMRI